MHRGLVQVRNPDLDPSQIILADVADYAPLDLVAATTMVRDKVRTIAHPNICMMMPCFRANLFHRSDSAVLDRLIDLVLGSSPRAGLDGRHAATVQKLPGHRSTLLKLVFGSTSIIVWICILKYYSKFADTAILVRNLAPTVLYSWNACDRVHCAGDHHAGIRIIST